MKLIAGQKLPSVKKRLFNAVTILCIFLMTPFVVNNFLQGRLLLGVSSLSVLIVLFVNAYSMTQLDRYYPNLIFFTLVPAIVWFLYQSVMYQGIIGVLWSFPAIYGFYILLPEIKARIANLFLLIVVIFTANQLFTTGLMIRIIITLLFASLLSAMFINLIETQHRKLETMASTDALTGLLNRSDLSLILNDAVNVAKRTDTPMSLLTFDLDSFKEINDDFGHSKGDCVLQEVANVISNQRRAVDKTFRLGGEEFLLLLHGANRESALIIAQNLCESIGSLDLMDGRKITTSIGVAELNEGETWSDWMKRSDNQLYAAKAKGKNCVVG